MVHAAWHGARAGGVAGLAMLGCALGLAHAGQPECLLAYRAWGPLAASSAHFLRVPALAPGIVVHEAVGMLVGGISASLLSVWAPLRLPLTFAGAGLAMGLADRVVLARRTPGMTILMHDTAALPYLAFAMVLAVQLLRVTRVAATVPIAHVATQARPTLQVVTAPHCFGCVRALQIAQETQTRFPCIAVEVVDLEQSSVQLPPGVVAVPCYILNGRALFTGNPTSAALDQAVQRAIDGSLLQPEQPHAGSQRLDR